jgi:lipopolysaccharide export LptBFGC system permease protein LptF
VPGSAARAEQIKNLHVPQAPDGPGRGKVANLVFSNARDNRDWHIGTYDLQTGEMLKPGPVISNGGPGPSRWLYADRGVRLKGVWTFYNAREYSVPAQSNAFPVPLLVTNVLAKPDFSETPEEIRSEVKISALLNPAALRSRTKNPDLPLLEILQYLRLHPKPMQASLLYTKLQGRLATPWTCLVVVLIAIPFGAASGRRNVFVGVASSILIFFAYYVLQQVCLALGAGGSLPAWVAGWLPNLAFGLTGLWLTTRVR